ncbi:MAG TPA: 4'-phosphopantetheinyl transferase superfamily protein [Opitutaceae bacterium]|jgi:4'-phosphopantetheinyl transferase|nr:4'-phosphopantetheinyl transferase superfamily protein [Opitutaceae bacterium]
MHPEGGWIQAEPPGALAEGELQLWRVRADRPCEDWRGYLPDAEWSALARFHFPADARREAASRAARRILIGRILGREPREVAFARGPQGKPELAKTGTGSPGAEELQFSASHSGDWALVGLARGMRLGVDVELERPADSEDIAGRFFAEEERRELAALAGKERERAFFALWTLKESYLKGLGRGLSQPLQSFAVRLQPAPELVRCAEGAGDWRLLRLPFEPGYAAAAAAEGDLRRCRTFALR